MLLIALAFSISNRLMLHDDFRTRNDIEKHREDGFVDICRKSRLMVHVEMPWPGKDVVDTLTRCSCGLFIYAATVLKFAGQKSSHPPKQLDIVFTATATVTPPSFKRELSTHEVVRNYMPVSDPFLHGECSHHTRAVPGFWSC